MPWEITGPGRWFLGARQPPAPAPPPPRRPASVVISGVRAESRSTTRPHLSLCQRPRDPSGVKERRFGVLAVAIARVLRAGLLFLGDIFSLLAQGECFPFHSPLGNVSCCGVASGRNSLVLPCLSPNYTEVAERVSLTFFNIETSCFDDPLTFPADPLPPCHVQNTSPLPRPAGFTSASELSLPTPLLSAVIVRLRRNFEKERLNNFLKVT